MCVFVAELATPGRLFVGARTVAAFAINPAVRSAQAEGGGLMPVGGERKTRLIMTRRTVLRHFTLVGVAVAIAAMRRSLVIQLGRMALCARQQLMSLLEFKLGLAIMVKGYVCKERILMTVGTGLAQLAFVLVLVAGRALFVHVPELIVDMAIQTGYARVMFARADLLVLVAKCAGLETVAAMAFGAVVVQTAMLRIHMAGETRFVGTRVGAW